MVAVRDHPLRKNHPEDPELQPLIDRLVTEALPGWRSMAMPDMFRSAGLSEVGLDIPSKVFLPAIGSASAAQTRNVREVLPPDFSAVGDIRIQSDAAKFLENLIRYLERDDTSTITVLVRGSRSGIGSLDSRGECVVILMTGLGAESSSDQNRRMSQLRAERTFREL